MNNQLVRVQVYLRPDDLAGLDQLAAQIKVTRSQIIRDATKAIATRYARTVELLGRTSGRDSLKELIGIEPSKTGRVGLNVDEIYLNA